MLPLNAQRLSKLYSKLPVLSFRLRYFTITFRIRLRHLPDNVRDTAHTFNRAASLKTLHERLANPIPHGSA